ncbi:hypothetical protein [Pseudomonas abietaniphila]|nr:hypothetical protein [Pseudomonas abietaniphila]
MIDGYRRSVHMPQRPHFKLSFAGGVLTLLTTQTSISQSLVADESPNSVTLCLTGGIIILAAAGFGCWYNYWRSSTHANKQRVLNQLRALEKLALRVGRAEQTLSLKCQYMSADTRADMRQVLYAITTDTIRGTAKLRRGQMLTDLQFRKLMGQSDEFFDRLDLAMSKVVTFEQEEEDPPFLMPARENPLPKPAPQPRPVDPLVSDLIDPELPAVIKMPDKPRPKAANADASSAIDSPAQVLSSVLLGGAMLFPGDDGSVGAGEMFRGEPQVAHEP